MLLHPDTSTFKQIQRERERERERERDYVTVEGGGGSLSLRGSPGGGLSSPEERRGSHTGQPREPTCCRRVFCDVPQQEVIREIELRCNCYLSLPRSAAPAPLCLCFAIFGRTITAAVDWICPVPDTITPVETQQRKSHRLLLSFYYWVFQLILVLVAFLIVSF